MDITITPSLLEGDIEIIPSKSIAHRALICSAFADKVTELVCTETNRDIEATVDCLRAIGVDIRRVEHGFIVTPLKCIPQSAVMNCCESGSTLRFLLPVVGALGIDTTFLMEGRLPERPLSPLWEEMERMGCSLSRSTENTLRCQGRLKQGDYAIDGGVSSQFISGLMLAHWLMNDCTLTITGNLESEPYVNMTKYVLSVFKNRKSPIFYRIEGDWSNGAFWIAANALGNDLNIIGMQSRSIQGDREVVPILRVLEKKCITISVKDIPDLVPILSVAASMNYGAVFTDIRRLRLKESDRVASTIAMLKALGGEASATENELTIFPAKLTGGTVNAMNDHRIAMSAAIAATVSSGPVTILGAECVKKSYPKFWDEYSRLGGKYE